MILIVGPVVKYASKEGRSPLAQIFRAWGIKAPVIDVAAKANATHRPSRLVFRYDGHLNPAGHRFLADSALEPLGEEGRVGRPPSHAIASARPHDRRNRATLR